MSKLTKRMGFRAIGLAIVWPVLDGCALGFVVNPVQWRADALFHLVIALATGLPFLQVVLIERLKPLRS